MVFDTLTTDKLCKTYGNTKAVDEVSVTVRAGGIYGLIGRNGAGKTTLIRMLGGLSVPDGGVIAVNGNADNKWLCECRRNMSFIVETPYFSPKLSAYDNMKAHCYLRGSSADKISAVLKTVELSDTGAKKSANFPSVCGSGSESEWR